MARTATTAPAPYVAGSSYLFATANCGRCGGSGFYSHGTCFGCNGSGLTLSRAAAKAKKAHEELVKQLAAITYADLQVGMKYRQPGTIYAKWTTVTAIEEDRHNAGHLVITRSRYGQITAPAAMHAGVRPLTTEEAAQVWDVIGRMPGVTLAPPTA